MSVDANTLVSKATHTALSSGTKLKKDRYEIREILGQGNFGITYGAYDSALRAKVAIKEYLPSRCSVFRDRNDNVKLLSNDRDFKRGLKSFLKEIPTLAKLNHPNIVRISDFFASKGTGYMVVMHESGESLAAFLERYRRLREKKVLEIILPLLDGLEMLHMEGILHRDIKPSNIIVRPGGSPCLLDLGTAQEVISKQHSLFSSSHYAPPERFEQHAEQGPWTDIYALGAVCYRIITGQQPRPALERLKAERSHEPDPLQPAQKIGRGHYRAGFLRAIDYALNLDPNQRPRNTLEWRELVVPTGAKIHSSDRKNGSLLGKLRHLFRSPAQHAWRPAREADSQPAIEAIPASAVVNPAMELRSAPPEEKETKPAGGIGYLSEEPAEPPSLPGTERAATPARNDLAEPDLLQESALPASATEELIPPRAADELASATTEPTAGLPDTRSIQPSAMPEASAPSPGVKPPPGIPARTDTPDRGTESHTSMAGGLDRLFESSRQPSIARSIGVAEPPPPQAETPRRETGWSGLFELYKPARSAANVFSVKQADVEASQVTRPLEKPEAPKDAATSAIAACNDRAWNLFRAHDFAGALAELEAAKALEPENAMLTANIKRIQQRMQRPAEREADPWETP